MEGAITIRRRMLLAFEVIAMRKELGPATLRGDGDEVKEKRREKQVLSCEGYTPR